MTQDTGTGPRGSLAALHAVIGVEGPDAAEFLHAQLSSDVKALAPADGQLTAYLSPKGRVLATAILLRQSDGFLLLVHPSLLTGLIDRLRLFVLRSRVSLAPRPELAVVGEWTAEASGGDLDLSRLPQRPGPLPALPWPGQRRIAVVEAAHAPDLSPEFAARWLAEDARHGLPWVQSGTADRHVAQMLDLDRLGALSFRKGCYPGQEIVARAHYLGRIKRRLARYRSGPALAPATPLLGPSGSAVGEVLYGAADGESHLLLAVVTTDDAAAELHSEDGARATPLGLAAETPDAV